MRRETARIVNHCRGVVAGRKALEATNRLKVLERVIARGGAPEGWEVLQETLRREVAVNWSRATTTIV